VVGGDLVLHLHRLDDAENLALPNLVAIRDLDREHRSLHRADDGVTAVAAGVSGTVGGALGVAPRELEIQRLGPEQGDLEAPAVELHRDGPSDGARGGRRPSDRPRELVRPLRQ
jgi:hypothetical protein